MRALVLILLTAFPVLSVGVEIPFSAPVLGPAASRQFAPSIGSSGEGYLVVWTDQRSALETYATRVSRSGEVLDPTGIRLGPSTSNERAVVWTGAEWAIVWNTPDGKLWESRVTEDGVVRHDAREIATGVRLPNVIQAGAHTVIGYSSMDHPFAPRALFVDGAGRVVRDVALATGDAERQSPALAWNGTHVVAVWAAGSRADDVEIEAVRVAASGLIDTAPRKIVTDGSPLAPRLASDGRDFLLVTRDNATRSDSARTLSADLATVGAPIDLPSGGIDPTTLLWTGSRYAVVSEDGASISAIRVDANGVVDQPVVVAEDAGMSAAPVAAAAGSDVLVAWVGVADPDAAEADFDIYATTVSSSLSGGERRLLSASAAAQTNPRVVSSGDTILTVWNEGSNLFVRRVTPDGVAIDAGPVMLSATANDVAATFGGATYLVAWTDVTRSLLMTMNVPEHGPIDPREAWRRDAINPGAIAVGSDGATSIVGWISGSSLQVASVDAAGMIREEPPLLVATGDLESLAIEGSDGGGFLVTWGDKARSESGDLYRAGVRGVVLSPELAVTSFPGFEIVDTIDEEGAPATTWNGSEWLVVWERSIRNRSELRARRISRDGWPVDGTARDSGVLIAEQAVSPRVAWDGARYSFAWRSAGGTPQIHLASSSGLAPQIPDGVHAADAAAAPALGVVSRGRVASAYSRIARESAYGGVARAFMELPEEQGGRRRSVR